MPLCEKEGKIKGEGESLTEKLNITTFLIKSVYISENAASAPFGIQFVFPPSA